MHTHLSVVFANIYITFHARMIFNGDSSFLEVAQVVRILYLNVQRFMCSLPAARVVSLQNIIL